MFKSVTEAFLFFISGDGEGVGDAEVAQDAICLS